jgi:hypothetical protein
MNGKTDDKYLLMNQATFNRTFENGTDEVREAMAIAKASGHLMISEMVGDDKALTIELEDWRLLSEDQRNDFIQRNYH